MRIKELCFIWSKEKIIISEDILIVFGTKKYFDFIIEAE